MDNKSPLLDFLKYAVSNKVSDIHLGDETLPMMRKDGDLVKMAETPFEKGDTLKMLAQHLDPERFKDFEREKELDYSFGVPGLARFRVNLYYQKDNVGAALRPLPNNPPTFEQIDFPVSIADQLVSKPSGLILVTGATGSGKTTTLSAMIDHINQHDACHIITIEDPIEIVYTNKKSVIAQREVGADTHSFNQALKHVLRQDPDVILVGEMRDLETIELALTAAETGHLVFATLHTPDAVQSINRIIDVFPAHQQQQVRIQFSFVLQAVICQQLIPREGGGLALAAEILLANHAIRSLIRDSKSHQVYSAIQMGQKEGMKTLNMSLAELVKTKKISKENAILRSSDVMELERLLLSAR